MTKQTSEFTANSIDHQISLFQKGTQYIKILRAATLKEGIQSFNNADRKDFIRVFEDRLPELDVVKFVPASGAATRMFQKTFEWVSQPKKHRKEINAFFDKADQFPFFEDWVKAAELADVETFECGLEPKVKWLRLLLDEGLAYASKPKGLIPFHVADGRVETPIHSHLAETLAYSKGKNGGRIHFTVSSEHQEAFSLLVDSVLNEMDEKVEVSYSDQLRETDTVTIGESGAPILNEKGDAIMRPGGHGALIHNLNELDAEIVFIKNIDNVCHPRLMDLTSNNKKLLGGILLSVRDDFKALHDQVSKGLVDATNIDQAREKWRLRIPRDYLKLKEYLKRPIRVCGMVKNEGEPGGGPFWSLDKFTGESLQIVEKAQVNTSEMRQDMILSSATHFNPVDLVCSMKGHDWKKINLLDYIDENQYFVNDKSSNGEPVKALEWPGLWNGGMAHWITVFVEVPSATFNPVKEVSDLLRPNHLNT